MTFQRILMVGVAGTMFACASAPRARVNQEDFPGKPLVVVNAVPFVEQTPQVCGPTALYMVAKMHRPDLTLEEVTQITFTPGAAGTYKQDLLAATRRLGLAPYSVSDSKGMIQEIAAGRPILLFHHTRFLFKEYWHYSVITGYNLDQQDFYLHIGSYRNRSESMNSVLTSWTDGEKWSYIVLPAGQLPQNAVFQEALDNALAFLRLNETQSAAAVTQAMDERWPARYETKLLQAEVYLKTNEKKRAFELLKSALALDPQNTLLKRKLQTLKAEMRS